MIAANEARVLQHLWVSVLSQAVRDIFRTASSPDGCSEIEHRAALAWIGSRDFHQVCALAGFDGVAVAGRLRRRLTDVRAGRFDAGAVLQFRPGVRRAGGQRGRGMARQAGAA